MYPYQQYQPYQPQFPYQQRQVLRANGKASVDAIKLAPGESALVMDTTAPLVWLCVADSLGNVSSTAYDITPHQETPPVDMGTLEQRLAAVENAVKRMEVNYEPNARNVDARQNERDNEPDTAHQTGNEHGTGGK